MMIKVNFVKAALFIVACLTSGLLNAQSSEVGFSFGISNYKGDVSPKLSMDNINAGFGGFYKKHISYALYWRSNIDFDRASASYATLGDDRLTPLDYSFTTNAISVATGLEYNFFDFRKKYNPIFSPYLFGQIGGVLPNTRSVLNGTESESSAPTVILPFGFGVKAVLSRRIVVSAEWRTTKVFSDKFDGVPFSSEEGGLEANTSSLDTFYRLNFTVSFVPVKVLCPKHTPKDPIFRGSRDY